MTAIFSFIGFGKERLDNPVFCDKMGAIAKAVTKTEETRSSTESRGRCDPGERAFQFPSLPSRGSERVPSVGGFRNAALKHKVYRNLSGASAQFEWYRGQFTLVSSN